MVSLANKINCGYIRVAMKQLSGKMEEFKRYFQQPMKMDDGYFVSKHDKKYPSLFEQHCKRMKDAFRQRWHPQSNKGKYERLFSLAQWERLSLDEKNSHTMENCDKCYQRFYHLQNAFPLKPVYKGAPAVEINIHKQTREENFVALTLKTLDDETTERYGHTFIESLIKEKKVDKHKTKCETMKQQRLLLKKCRDNLQESFEQTVPTTIMKENESIASYNRKRKALYFIALPNSKKKKHSPNFDNSKFDKHGLLEHLKETLSKGKKVVWSAAAKQYGIKSKNGGQIAKEYAALNGINTEDLDLKARKKHERRAKRKLPGGQISVPVPPAPSVIKDKWKQMVEEGELQLGVPCHQYTITRYVATNGELQMKEDRVEGRKIPLKDIRQKLLYKQEAHMHLLDDQKIEYMDIEEMRKIVETYDSNIDWTMSIEETKLLLKSHQRTRTLCIWHDHATILGQGYIMVTIGVIYDPAVFKKDMTCSSSQLTVQTMIEEPHIYMFALNSPSIEDQAALIPDRVECFAELKEPVVASNGVEVHDVVRFFVGDHPAKQFERGTQCGGTYKCGGCGCKANMMDDQAHALECKTRTLMELQKIATDGVLGKKPGNIKPLYVPDLTVADIRKELQARSSTIDTTKCRKSLQAELQNILKGVQRVPSILILNPVQPLKELNMDHYAILDNEPMHDLKGHLINLLSEMPTILPLSVRDDCTRRIKECLSKDKKSAADLRTTIIHIHLLLLKSDVQWEVKALVESIVHVSEIMYLSDNERVPATVLRLYNSTWLHHALCYELFQSPQSRTSLFGLYLHSISKHSPEQYELVCLKSVNAESQERMFGQCRRIAENATNRQPMNIITNVMLRMQMKSIHSDKEITIVRAAAKNIPSYGGTFFPTYFIQRHHDSWQSHLKRISPYLACGEGVWWRKEDNGYTFLDTDVSITRPSLLHFRASNLKDVQDRQVRCWDEIIRSNINLPAVFIKVYSADETSITRKEYPLSIDSTADPCAMNDEISVQESSSAPLQSAETEHTTTDIRSTTLETQCFAQEFQLPCSSVSCASAQYPSSSASGLDVSGRVNTSLTLSTNEESEQQIPGIKTKLAKAIATCTGVTDEIRNFDRLRSILKTHQHNRTCMNKGDITAYNNLLTTLKASVMNKKRQHQEELKLLEKEYFLKEGHVPTSTTASEKWKTIVNQRSYAAKLLQTWESVV